MLGLSLGTHSLALTFFPMLGLSFGFVFCFAGINGINSSRYDT